MTEDNIQIQELKYENEYYKAANRSLLKTYADLKIEIAMLRKKVEIYEAFLKGERRK